ncbi:hypothetical protein NON00_04700 [Roseomonas sp. GC11]|uniref:hypothetical protein n=1 Tax=Roseomonas sp. GC11 TaxID=2950546 RepID=UPI00210A2C83|nr:hypothetical protein [Roseomonas sp. GC11]MCQ4159221.1 hypothetical protein [Roseomonas sp. GC11]
MAKNVRNFVNRAFMRTVDLDLLQELLEPYATAMAFAWDDLPADEAARREALFDLFKNQGERFPDPLLDALHCILILSNPNGQRALEEIAALNGVQLVPEGQLDAPDDGRQMTPRHLALHAYLRHPQIFQKAVHRHALFAASPLRLVGARRGVCSRHDEWQAQEAFRAACSAFFARRYQGRICEVYWYPEAEAVNVIVEHGMNAITTTVEEAGEQKVRNIREMTLDTICYEPIAGHIKVNARSPIERRALVSLFAQYLLGEPDFFTRPGSDRLYTLRPLQQKGVAWQFLNDWDEELREVFVKEIEVDEADPDRASPGGSPWRLTVWDNENALARLSEMVPGIDLATLRISHLKLLLRFDVDGRRQDVMVTIRPHNVVSFRDHMFEARIFQHLRHNGLSEAMPSLQLAAAAA